jgi:hypothetical protein
MTDFFYNNMMIYLDLFFIFPLAMTNLSYNIYFVDMKWMASPLCINTMLHILEDLPRHNDPILRVHNTWWYTHDTILEEKVCLN